ncbi:DTW domain-containing protein [Pavlovales sp. CCMP2436]|nr:DTW domain-containing protein [Pavlovales sp. CCMP2436]
MLTLRQQSRPLIPILDGRRRTSPFAPADGRTAYNEVMDAVIASCEAVRREYNVADLDQLPSEQRNVLRVKINMAARIRKPIFEGSRCRYCFHGRCICRLLPRPRGMRHRLWLWIHHTDLLRSSNSGKLLAITCPDARLAVAGCPETEAALMSLLAERRPTTCIVFPAENSRSTAEYAAFLRESSESTGAGASACDGLLLPVLDIIVIDGTWATVKSIVRRVPSELNFVRVNLSCQPSMFSSRTQGSLRESKGFTSTLEACAALLDELGESPTVSAALRDSFKLNDDTVMVAKRGLEKQAYGSWLPNAVSVVERGGYVDA